jgi:neutral ceramidase
VFAYIPTLRVLKEGGYEGGGAMIPYGQPAPFTSAVEELIADKVNAVVTKCRAQ